MSIPFAAAALSAARYTEGAHTTTSHVSAARRGANASSQARPEAREPFIFQFAATSEVRRFIIGQSLPL
jgi:hypothetical protein